LPRKKSPHFAQDFDIYFWLRSSGASARMAMIGPLTVLVAGY
jgi:hypothetical protein